MVSDALRKVMLAADGAGHLTGSDVVSVAAEHPICGDAIELDFRVVDERIEEFAWRATGCPATLAVVAAASSALVGGRVSDAEERLQSRLQALGGLAVTERHATAMFLRALAQVSVP